VIKEVTHKEKWVISIAAKHISDNIIYAYLEQV